MSDYGNKSYSYSHIEGGVKGHVSYSNIAGVIYPDISLPYQYNNIINGFFTYKIGTMSNLLWSRPGGLGSPQNLSLILNGTLWAGGGNDVVIVDDIFVPLLGNPELLSDWVIWDLSDATGNSFPN